MALGGDGCCRGEEEEGEEQLHALLAADLGGTPPPQVRVPSGPPLPAAHSPAAGGPWGHPGTCGAESRGTPLGGVGRKGARRRPPQGTPVETGVSPSPPYLCGIPGRTLSAGGRATASRRGCEGTPEPGVGGCTAEPRTCGNKGRGGGDPGPVLSSSWGPGGAPEGLEAAGAAPCSILCCHHNTSLLLATRAGLPPTAGQQKSRFCPQNLWLCCCPSGAELPRPPDSPPKATEVLVPGPPLPYLPLPGSLVAGPAAAPRWWHLISMPWISARGFQTLH